MNGLRWILLGLLSLHVGNCQSGADRTTKLIAFLTHPPFEDRIMFSCGMFNKYSNAARSLADIGTPAIPKLERALDSIEKLGDKSPFIENSYWLALAYASIQGLAALPRFRRMGSEPKLGITMDNAMALSLSLTSVVSSTRWQGRVFRCHRPDGEPRDALDHLILDWETAELNRTYPPLAVAYQFEIPGGWSEPTESMRGRRAVGPLAEQERVEIETTFHKLSGGDCARTRVIFRRVPSAQTIDAYVVDDESRLPVLNALAVCAAPLSESAKTVGGAK